MRGPTTQVRVRHEVGWYAGFRCLQTAMSPDGHLEHTGRWQSARITVSLSLMTIPPTSHEGESVLGYRHFVL